MPPCVGREPSVSLSPVEADSRAVMQANMRFRVPDRWSILLTFEKLKGWTGCTSNAVALQKNDPGTGLWGLGLRRGHLGGTSLERPATFGCKPITSDLAALVSFAHLRVSPPSRLRCRR